MGDSPLPLSPYDLGNFVSIVEIIAGVILTIGSLVFVQMMRKGRFPKD